MDRQEIIRRALGAPDIIQGDDTMWCTFAFPCGGGSEKFEYQVYYWQDTNEFEFFKRRMDTYDKVDLPVKMHQLIMNCLTPECLAHCAALRMTGEDHG